MKHPPRIHTLEAFGDWESFASCRILYDTNPMFRLPRHLRIPLTGLPLAVLTTLELQNIHFRKLDWALLLISTSPKLEDLRILCEVEGMKVPKQPKRRLVDLPLLRRLSIEFPFLKALLCCTIHIPIIEFLYLSNPDYLDPSVLESMAWPHSLQSLDLVGNFNDSGVAHILTHTHLLRFLTLRKSQAGDDLLGFWLSRDDRLAPDMELLRITEGSCSDRAVLHLLESRLGSDSEDGTVAVEVVIRACPNNTSRLGQELRRRKRGTWIDVLPQHESVEGSYVYSNPGLSQ